MPKDPQCSAYSTLGTIKYIKYHTRTLPTPSPIKYQSHSTPTPNSKFPPNPNHSHPPFTAPPPPPPPLLSLSHPSSSFSFHTHLHLHLRKVPFLTKYYQQYFTYQKYIHHSTIQYSTDKYLTGKLIKPFIPSNPGISPSNSSFHGIEIYALHQYIYIYTESVIPQLLPSNTHPRTRTYDTRPPLLTNPPILLGIPARYRDTRYT